MDSVSLLTPTTLLGGCILGICIGVISYGFLMGQVFIYYSIFPEDTRSLKLTVAFLCLLETIFTACTVHWLYHLTITGFGSLAFDTKLPWSPAISLITETIMASLVQSLNLGRLWGLSQHKIYLVAPIAILLIARFGTTIPNIILIIETLHLRGIRRAYHGRSDILPVSESNGIQHEYFVNTGGLTMAVSISYIITFTILQDSLTYWGLWSIMGRLYANSYLGTLNCRHILRRKAGDFVHPANHITTTTETVVFASALS
ncbi:hypothetical protein K474DRAFT_401886 [Panus rudis PR-1116 ss-1]|nr:hypothetical protein K474DRAFT_401886 [Panus rudis PR-1116 ss-1]